jgi:RNA polymerase sigma-70 factor (ECF subfamily)
MLVETMSCESTPPAQDPDYEHACAARGGSDEAFAALVRSYTGPIYTLAIRVLGSRDDAEDAVQEIFLKAYRGLDRFDCNFRFFSWLYTIARNHLSSVGRRRMRKLEPELQISEELVAAPGRDEPAAQVEAAETRTLVYRAIDHLSPVQQRVFSLRQLQGISTAETAEILGLPENTVKTHLRRARARIAREIAGGNE